MSKNALVVFYEGQVLSDYLVSRVMQTICTEGQRSTEGIHVVSLSEQDLVKLLVRNASTELYSPAVIDVPELDPMEAALTYIGERFNPAGKGSIELVTQLCAAASTECNTNIELENAMYIIATKPVKRSNEQTCKKYGITNTVRGYIKQVYNQIYVPRDQKVV